MADELKHEFRAVARGVRMSARKARLVMDVVRGRNAKEAVTLLQFVNKRAAPDVRKLIQSAMANAEEYANRKGVPVAAEELVVFDARADIGPQMKRWRPRSRGMANPFTKHTCHITVTLAEADFLAERAGERPHFARKRRRLSRDERLAKKGILPQQPPADEKEAPEAKAPAPRVEAKAKKPTRSAKARGKGAAKGRKPAAKGGAKKKPGKK